MSPELLERFHQKNLDAERSALGAMFLDKEAIYRAMESCARMISIKIPTAIFTRPSWTLPTRGEPVDLVTVTEALRQSKRLDEVGGVAYLTELANAVPTAAHIDHYARIVEEKSLLRRLIHAAGEIMAAGYGAGRKFGEILDEAERKIFSVANRRSGRSISSLKQILIEAFDK